MAELYGDVSNHQSRLLFHLCVVILLRIDDAFKVNLVALGSDQDLLLVIGLSGTVGLVPILPRGSVLGLFSLAAVVLRILFGLCLDLLLGLKLKRTLWVLVSVDVSPGSRRMAPLRQRLCVVLLVRETPLFLWLDVRRVEGRLFLRRGLLLLLRVEVLHRHLRLRLLLLELL